MHALGLLALAPATVLLTISFFVLFTVCKVETQGLKWFGTVLAVMLWVSAALVLGAGLFCAAKGCEDHGWRQGMLYCPMMDQKWQGREQWQGRYMRPDMMGGNMVEDKGMMVPKDKGKKSKEVKKEMEEKTE